MISLNYKNDDVVQGFDGKLNDNIKIKLQPFGDLEPGTIIVYLKGYLDTYNSPYFRDQMSEVINAGFHKLIFCCEELTYISSTGVATFPSILK